MTDAFFDNPILNSPYEYPARYCVLDDSGQPTNRILESRCDAKGIRDSVFLSAPPIVSRRLSVIGRAEDTVAGVIHGPRVAEAGETRDRSRCGERPSPGVLESKQLEHSSAPEGRDQPTGRLVMFAASSFTRREPATEVPARGRCLS